MTHYNLDAHEPPRTPPEDREGLPTVARFDVRCWRCDRWHVAGEPVISEPEGWACARDCDPTI